MRHRSVHRRTALVASLRYVAHRYALVLTVLSALAIFSFAQTHQGQVAALRMRLIEASLPVANFINAPLTAIDNARMGYSNWHDAVGKNEKLVAENTRLRAWQQEAMRLTAENERLRALLLATPPVARTALTVPVVGDAGGSFQRALLALAGINNAVEVGSVALGATAVIGRVVEIGNRTSRVLLLTDINSRIPVRLESTAEQAIAAGNGSSTLQLKYLADDAVPVIGERVITSGHGGIYPAGLPVGTIVKDGSGYAVLPLEDVTKLEWVRILDYRNPSDIVSK